MRTTVTLDTDTEQLVHAAMRERGLSFKQAVNDAIRAGLGGKTAQRAVYRLPTFSMGRVACGDLNRALDGIDEEEDTQVALRMRGQR